MMELLLIAVGVVVVVVAAILVFFVFLKTMPGSSFEDAFAEKMRRQQMVEDALGIRSKETAAKKEKKKPPKKSKTKARDSAKSEEDKGAKRDESVGEGSGDDEQSSGTEEKILGKDKKQKSKVVGGSLKEDKHRIQEKTETKTLSKSETTRAVGTGTKMSGTKTNNQSLRAAAAAVPSGKAKKVEDPAASFESEMPFVVAESRNKKKKTSISSPVSTSEKLAGDAGAKAVGTGTTSANIAYAVAPSKSLSTGQQNSLPKVQQPVNKSASMTTGSRIQPPLVKTSDDVARLSGSDAQWTQVIPKGDLIKRAEDKNEEQKEPQSPVIDTRVQQELKTLRQSYAALESKSRDDLAQKVKEIEALKLRMSQTHAEHVAEINQLRVTSKCQGAADGGQMQLITILSEENRKLKEEISAAKNKAPSGGAPLGSDDLQQKLKIMDDALKANAMLLNVSENAKKNLDLKLKQADDKLRKTEEKLRATEANFEQKFSSASEELQKSEVKNRALSEELETAKKENAEFQNHHLKLEAEEKRTFELENQIKSLESQFSVFEQLIHQKDTELESVQGRSSQLTEELKIAKEQNDQVSQELEEHRKRLEETERLFSQTDKLKVDLQTSQNNEADLEIQLKQVRQSEARTQVELTHYQNILTETEKLLSQIQSSVDLEEKNWFRKLTDAEELLQESQRETKKLEEELTKLKTNSKNLEINGTSDCDDLSEGAETSSHPKLSSGGGDAVETS